MGTCRETFVLIQQKLAEKTHPGRITITIDNITHAADFPFFSTIAGKRIFSWEVALNTLISCSLSTVGEAYK